MRTQQLVAILAAITLTACGGGGGDGSGPSGFCNGSFSGSQLVVDDSACPNCEISNSNNTIDDNGNTFMTVTFPPSGGQMRLRADRRDGSAFPQSSSPGSLMLYPSGNFGQSGTQTQLYMGDQPAGAGNQTTTVGSPPGAGTETYYPAIPTSDFDAIEVLFSITGNAEPETVLFFETCGDG
ncbi:hypothetical protein GYB61_05765 [bacterium]|nr:hypothetical protein [bacterium]